MDFGIQHLLDGDALLVAPEVQIDPGFDLVFSGLAVAHAAQDKGGWPIKDPAHFGAGGLLAGIGCRIECRHGSDVDLFVWQAAQHGAGGVDVLEVEGDVHAARRSLLSRSARHSLQASQRLPQLDLLA